MNSNKDKYITIIVNPEQSIFVVDKQIMLKANDEGVIRLNIMDLLVQLPNTVKGFERELQSLLTEDQQYAMFAFLGSANIITITALSSVLGISKSEAKDIINLGIRYSTFVTGWNNTYKLVNKTLKERMEERARNRFTEDKHNLTPLTVEEQIDQTTERMGKIGIKMKKDGGRGEVGVGMGIGEDSTMTVVTSKAMPKKKEKSVEVVNADGVDDSKWYSGVDKDKQRKEAEERNRIEAAKALEEMNRGSGVPQKRQTAVEIDPITRKPIKKESQVKVVEGVKGMSSGYIQKDSKGIPSKKKPSTSKGVRRT